MHTSTFRTKPALEFRERLTHERADGRTAGKDEIQHDGPTIIHFPREPHTPPVVPYEPDRGGFIGDGRPGDDGRFMVIVGRLRHGAVHRACEGGQRKRARAHERPCCEPGPGAQSHLASLSLYRHRSVRCSDAAAREQGRRQPRLDPTCLARHCCKPGWHLLCRASTVRRGSTHRLACIRWTCEPPRAPAQKLCQSAVPPVPHKISPTADLPEHRTSGCPDRKSV